MKKQLKMLYFLLVLLLVSCTTLNYPPPVIGMSEQELIAKSGKPINSYQDGSDRLLEYSSQWGQYTYMARIGSDGRLKSWEQVLTSQKFATVKIGETTKQQILLTFGKPVETAFFPRLKQEVWSYRYKQDEIWNSLMHIHFDQAGIVRMMQNGPDPAYDTSDRRP